MTAHTRPSFGPGVDGRRRSSLSPRALWRTLEEFRHRNGPGSVLWSYEVSNRGGAAIALLLRETPVTPNWITVSGLLIHLATSAYVALLSAPVSIGAMLPALVGWQLAYCLDCADGQLARERRQTSPFGAWLDQIFDAASHSSVMIGLTLYLVRAVNLTAFQAALLVGVTLGSNLLFLFGWTLRILLVGPPRASLVPTGASARPLAQLVQSVHSHLTDYGVFTFLASILLLAPQILLVYLGGMAAVWTASVAAIVVYLWAQARATS